jgi:hypothetical protein
MRIRSHNSVRTARIGGSLGQEVDLANDAANNGLLPIRQGSRTSHLLMTSLTVSLQMHEEQIPSCCSVCLNILQSTGFMAHAEHDNSDRRSARMVDNQAPR